MSDRAASSRDALLDRAQKLGAAESGLAIAITLRADGSTSASVVNAGVLDHPVTSERVVGFVARGRVKKLANIRARPRVSVVFRSGWDWVAVDGDAELVGPSDPPPGVAGLDLLPILRRVYAAAVGGTEDDWAGMDEAMAAEGHTAVLIRPDRVYSNPA